MPFVQAFEGCMAAAIGESGLTQSMLDERLVQLDASIAALKTRYEEHSLPLLRVPERIDDIDEAADALQRLSDGARTLVFFGTGGSSLGGQTIAQLGGWFIPGDQKVDQTRRPRTRFYDNLDPRTLESTLAALDLAATRFIVISKSGNTPETLVQFFAALQAVQAAGLEANVPELFLGLTEPEKPGVKNGLRKVCAAHGIPMLDHDPGIGGRYAGLTNVGILPALARGLDASALRRGASKVVSNLLSAKEASTYAPALGAALSIGLAQEKGTRVQVMMPYSDRLQRFADWYVQLAGESLGKNGTGLTPVAALGPVDQHSKLQFYLDGPPDHLITVLRTACEGTGPEIVTGLADTADAPYLGGRTVGALVAAQQAAIPQALMDAGRPVRTFDIERLDEQALGGLMMHFMLETILSGHLLGVDPFDQPAVEAGKVLTRRNLEGRR
ncbi:MAG: glucose-6-phosphate isomerase [Hyphomicrobiaceae bacterium]|nr:glucose-6-phosphate isomerase [Hyphomicrobiaceae bacterium]